MRYEELLELAPNLREYAETIPEELDDLFQLRAYEAHQIIHQKDSPLERIGILVKGTFRVVNEFENGNVFMIEINEPVSFVGEVTLLAGSATTSVTIETVTPCLVAFLPVTAFDAWLHADIEFLRAVSQHVAKKLYCSSYNRGERLFYSAKYVLLKYLTQKAEESGIRDKESVVIRKTRQEIGEEVGMTVKTINRILARFCQGGLISIDRGKATMDSRQYQDALSELKIYISESRNGQKNWV